MAYQNCQKAITQLRYVHYENCAIPDIDQDLFSQLEAQNALSK